MQNWDYFGIFPNGAEQSAPFWGIHGIKSTSGSYTPKGTLSADTTTPVTPDTVTITCYAVFTSTYQWEKKVGGTWSPLLGQTRSVMDVDYSLGDAGVYNYRCKLSGWAGTVYTDAITITVTEPTPIITITADTTEISIGETVTFTAIVTPYPEYARSIEWQQSTDSTTWTEIGTGETFSFTPTTAGTYLIRAIAIGYGASGTSNSIEITVN